jgi:tetratricopeptide (TPR) repeat protein
MATRKTSTTRTAPRNQEAYLQAEKSYRDAMALFIQKRDWVAASAAFATFIERHESERDLAEMVDRARVHQSSCQTRLAASPPPPKTATEWMLLGVAEGNNGNHEQALEAFSKAQALGAAPDKVEYSRAAALSMLDRQEESLEALKRAISLNAACRVHSLSDPDFERLRETAGYVALVDPPTEFDSRAAQGLVFAHTTSPAGFEELQDDDLQKFDPDADDDLPEEFGSEDELI